ncbi:hypothetical protein, partial [uncultured Methylobacterium sp.]|uniref:hypothetical protein n=1 Tax=uncultured Methylobacterium sp. TaxID=157278 RepID=UPI0035CC48C4
DRSMSAPDVVTVRVPFRTVRRGGRKIIVLPECAMGPQTRPTEPEVDAVLLRAIVRAWRWRRDIEEGRAHSIIEIAERERLTDSFVVRVLALTTLAPDILQAVLDGRLPQGLTLEKVIGSVSLSWSEQRGVISFEIG